MSNHEFFQESYLIQDCRSIGLGCLFGKARAKGLSSRPMLVPITEGEDGAVIIGTGVESTVLLEIGAIAKYSGEGQKASRHNNLGGDKLLVYVNILDVNMIGSDSDNG
jgi:hypothetical protein